MTNREKEIVRQNFALYEENRRTKDPLAAPSYNPKTEQDMYLNRLVRQLKYVILGGTVGLTIGLALGVLVTSYMDMPILNKVAYDLSMGVTGTILGVVAGSVQRS